MARGEGCALCDVEGRRYLDMTAGIAVCVLGHGHPGLADAIAAQARRLLHVSNLYYIEAQLAARRGAVPARVRGPRVLLQLRDRGQRGRAQAGAPLSDRHARPARAHRDRRVRQQLSRPHAGRAQRHRPAEVPRRLRPAGRRRSRFMPFGDVAAARAAITDRTAAVIVEPIQAEGGINLPPAGLPAGAAARLHRRGRRADLRRGADRHRPHRHVLRVRGRGRRARRRDAGQGAGGRRADRRDAGQRGGRARLRAGHARVDVRRQPARVRRGAVRPEGDRRAGPARALPRDGRVTSARRCCGWRSGGGPGRAARAGGACCRAGHRRRSGGVVTRARAAGPAAVGGGRQRRALRAAADRRQSRDRRGDRNPGRRARRGEVGRWTRRRTTGAKTSSASGIFPTAASRR